MDADSFVVIATEGYMQAGDDRWPIPEGQAVFMVRRRIGDPEVARTAICLVDDVEDLDAWLESADAQLDAPIRPQG